MFTVYSFMRHLRLIDIELMFITVVEPATHALDLGGHVAVAEFLLRRSVRSSARTKIAE